MCDICFFIASYDKDDSVFVLILDLFGHCAFGLLVKVLIGCSQLLGLFGFLLFDGFESL